MDVLAEVRAMLAKILKVPVEDVDPDAPISSFGDLDSLKFEVLVLELERRIGKKIDPVKLLGLRNARDVAALIGSGKD